MAQRRLARLEQAGDTQTVNWIVEATTTYDTTDPGADPVVWGTEAEIAFLDRAFLAVGNEVTHDGMLLTLLNSPDRAFYGAQVKIRPTFTDTVDPNLELWTQATDGTWQIRRRVALAAIARSGDTLILDLTFDALFAADDAIPAKIWITLDTLGVDTSLTWLVCHLYGDCTQDPRFDDCPPGTPPEDCENVECSVDELDWLCIPLPLPPDLPNPAPVELPPIDVDVLMAETYTEENGAFVHDCPAPNRIVMYFGDLPGGGSVRVDVLKSFGIVFAEGASQTISAVGTLTWTVSAGYAPNDPNVGNGSAAGYLPPREVTDHLTFRFTRIVADPALQITLLDILTYWWTYDLEYEAICDLEPIAGLPPAQDPPDDADQTTYQRVYERWLVYADTEANATAAVAAEAARVDLYQRFYDANGRPLYGLRPEDALLFQAALEHTSPYLNATFNASTFVAGQHTGLLLDFNQLADGHVIAFRVYAVPVATLLLIPSTKGGRPRFPNPFATARQVIPYNPTVDVQSISCDVTLPCSVAFDSDLGQRFRFFRNFSLTPQIMKFAGPAIQPAAYHLERGVTEDEGFDTIALRPYPTPSSPYQQQWNPCTTPIGVGNLRCHQWFTSGWAYLITVRVYEPTATPIGAAVEIVPTVDNPSAFQVFGMLPTVAGGTLELDGRWP